MSHADGLNQAMLDTLGVLFGDYDKPLGEAHHELECYQRGFGSEQGVLLPPRLKTSLRAVGQRGQVEQILPSPTHEVA